MIADLFTFAVLALALLGLLTVCEAGVVWMERRGWLDDELLPWEQDERGAV